MTTPSLTVTLDDDALGSGSAVAAHLRRLVDVSLATPLEQDLFLVHPWTAQALRSTDPDDEGWQGRCRRAAEERLRRINAGEAGLEEVAEAARNFLGRWGH